MSVFYASIGILMICYLGHILLVSGKYLLCQGGIEPTIAKNKIVDSLLAVMTFLLLTVIVRYMIL